MPRRIRPVARPSARGARHRTEELTAPRRRLAEDARSSRSPDQAYEPAKAQLRPLSLARRRRRSQTTGRPPRVRRLILAYRHNRPRRRAESTRCRTRLRERARQPCSRASRLHSDRGAGRPGRDGAPTLHDDGAIFPLRHERAGCRATADCPRTTPTAPARSVSRAEVADGSSGLRPSIASIDPADVVLQRWRSPEPARGERRRQGPNNHPSANLAANFVPRSVPAFAGGDDFKSFDNHDLSRTYPAWHSACKRKAAMAPGLPIPAGL